MKPIIKRVIAVLYLKHFNRTKKVTMGNAVITAILNHPDHFPPAEIIDYIEALQAATESLSLADANTSSGSHLSFAAVYEVEVVWDTAMRNMASYVQQKADAQPVLAAVIITSSSLKIRKDDVKTSFPKPVLNLVASVTGRGDSIKLSMVSDNPYGSRHEIMITTTPELADSWVTIANITARKLMVKNLTNGVRYYFKVRVINSCGASLYSNVISQFAA